MKAYLIQSVQNARKRHPGSTESNPTVIDLPAKEFDRLAAMGAVRKPTERELRMATVEDAEVLEESGPEDDEGEGEGEGEGQTQLTDEEREKALRDEYEELFGTKPGNMKPETIAKKIAEKRAEDDNLGV